jgi:regulator of RNase E activity RraB
VSQGYHCEDLAAEEGNPLEFKLLVSREDTTTEENIDEVVLYLWETAQEFDGEYDGWETSVVRG